MPDLGVFWTVINDYLLRQAIKFVVLEGDASVGGFWELDVTEKC